MSNSRELHKLDTQPYRVVAGIYLLILNKRVIHVGHSSNAMKEIFLHDAKSFDSYAIHECNPNEMVTLEAEYIQKYLPNQMDKQESYQLRIDNVRNHMKENMSKMSLYFHHDMVGFILNDAYVTIASIRKNPEKPDEYQFRGHKGVLKLPYRDQNAGTNCGQILVGATVYRIESTTIINEFKLVSFAAGSK